MGFLRHSVLALRVLQWVLLASLGVFALATAFGFAHERQKALNHAHANAQEAVGQSLSAVSASLWQYDVAGLQAVLSGMVASRVVVRAEVIGLEQVVADVRQPGFTGAVDHVWTVPVMAQDQQTTIGALRISESYAQANAEVAGTLKTLVMTDLAKIVGLALVLFAIVYRKITRHLRQLAQDVTRLGHSGNETALSVDRKKSPSDHDEIDVLVDAINRFVAERNQEMHRRADAETERRNAELALLQSEESLAITLHSIGDAVIATNEAGQVTRMNPTAQRLTGWALADALGRPLSEVFRIVHATTREPVTDPVHRVMEHGEVVGLANHTVLLAKSGQEYQIADSAAPIRNAAGDIVGVVLVFSDVTERYLAQEALEESRERHRALSEAAFEAIFISEKGVCLEQNSQAQQMFGYTLDEAIGRIGTNWIAPGDRATVIRHAMSGHEGPYEVMGLRKDGTTFPAVIRAKMMHYRNKDVRVTSISDITERKQAQERASESEERYRTLIEWSPSAIGVHCGGTLLYANAAAVKLFGANSGQDLIGTPVLDRVHPDFREAVFTRVRNFIAAGKSAPMVRSKFLKMDGTAMDVEVQGTPIVFDGQKSTLFAMHDITESRRASEELRIAATAFESQQGMTITDSHRVILRVNKAFTAITGYSAEEAVGQTPRLLSSGRHDKSFYAAMTQALETEGAWTGEIWNRRKSGEVYPEWLTISGVKDNAGLTTHFVAIFSDVSERFKAQSQIDALAFYDPLTQLPNRRLLLDRLGQALHVSTRHTRNSALLFVDLDNFKTLNDTLGHFQGDSLLMQVAQRLKTCIREGDTVARLGSDEFVVMLEDLSEDDIEAATQAETVGDKILGAFVADFSIDGCAFHGTASIGVTLFGGETPERSEQPLQRAELAMFQAKSAGRNALRFFDAKMQAEVSARATLEGDLREAVLNQQFVLHYQPQVVGAGRITGVEALVRWWHPVRGMVSPAAFIPLAEESGLILQIGQWVLDAACFQLAAWATTPELAHLTMAVNVSARQFQQANFVDSVLATLARTGATPKLLKLELTESMLVHDVEGIIDKMSALKFKGVSFSLDDFGTGYSSLSYLKRLPLGQLKIDQGFVRNIVTDPNDAAIAKMVVALAESLGLAVIAEGVELQAQADFLAHLGCHAYQGYLFSRPLPPQELAAFVTIHGSE